MKVILYMAITVNGFIGLPDGNSDWVSEADWKYFSKKIKECGFVVMGRKTYEVCKEEFPFKSALNIVLTMNKKLLKEDKDYLFTNKSPKEIVKFASKKGHKSVLVIGGRETITNFLKDDLIDEIILSVHPLLFTEGMGLSKPISKQLQLRLLSLKKLEEDLVQLRYKVIK